MKWLVVVVLCLCAVGFVNEAQARDVRLALVVGHQRGWANEQPLPWVLSGDVRPMTATLKRLGYRVIRSENPTPSQVRALFRQVKQVIAQHRVTTFLFYYSGHADKRFFHLGARQGRPLGYREFLSFFLLLPVKRRFAILDACYGGHVMPVVSGTPTVVRKPSVVPSGASHHRVFRVLNQQLPKKKRFGTIEELRLWYTLRLPKGVRRPKKAFNFARTPFLRRENGAGVQIIGTVGVAWHDPSMRASLLTAYLLRGLRGAADNVKDGRITLEELYNFVRARLHQKGQTLNRFSLFNGDYTLAPNYQSTLHLASHIEGRINVSIDQFTWHVTKRGRSRIAIPTIPGQGTVEIAHRGKCWRQTLSFPKGKSVKVSHYGRETGCTKLVALRKGSVHLNARTVALPYEPDGHVLSASVGVAQLGESSLATTHPSFSLGYRFRWVGMCVDYFVGARPEGKSFDIHRLFASLIGGVPLSLSADGKFGLFVGGFARLGLTWVQLTQELRQVLSWGAGALVEGMYWIRPWFAVQLGAEAGLDMTPTSGLSGRSFQWNLRIACLFRW